MEEDEADRFWRVPSHPTSIPSSSPPTRVPSSESHHALVSVFPVELQEDGGESDTAPRVTHTHPSSSPPPFSSSSSSILPLFPSSLTLFLSIALSPLLSVFSHLPSAVYPHQVHLTQQCVCVGVPCRGTSTLICSLCCAQRPSEAHSDRWRNSRRRGGVRVGENGPNRLGDPKTQVSLSLYVVLPSSVTHTHTHTHTCKHPAVTAHHSSSKRSVMTQYVEPQHCTLAGNNTKCVCERERVCVCV